MKKIAFALAFALTLVSCEDEIDFTGREPDQMLVLNCIAQPDSALTARVTLTRFFLDDNPHRPVADAQITLTVRGADYPSTHLGGGTYAFAYIPQPGDTLTLAMRNPLTDSLITGRTIVPQRPELSDASLTFDTTFRPLAFLDTCVNVYRIAFRLQDDPLRDEFFRLRVLCDLHNDTLDLADHRATLCLASDIFTRGSTLLFTDQSFNQLQDTIQLVIFDDSTQRSHFRIVLEALSPEFYQYALSYNAQVGGGMGSEPANVPTNLTGGALGLLGSSAQTLRPLTLDKSPSKRR